MRLGHDDVSSLKIECQPRKRCHNIPRVRNPGAWISIAIFFLPSLHTPLSLSCFREREKGETVGRIRIHFHSMCLLVVTSNRQRGVG